MPKLFLIFLGGRRYFVLLVGFMETGRNHLKSYQSTIGPFFGDLGILSACIHLLLFIFLVLHNSTAMRVSQESLYKCLLLIT